QADGGWFTRRTRFLVFLRVLMGFVVLASPWRLALRPKDVGWGMPSHANVPELRRHALGLQRDVPDSWIRVAPQSDQHAVQHGSYTPFLRIPLVSVPLTHRL